MIGAGAVVLKEVPAGATMIGMPGRIAKNMQNRTRKVEDQNHMVKRQYQESA